MNSTDLKVGQKFTGEVTQIKHFGIFVRSIGWGKELTGLCRRSEISASHTALGDLNALYRIGDKVRVAIRSIDESSRQFYLTMDVGPDSTDATASNDDTSSVKPAPEIEMTETPSTIDTPISPVKFSSSGRAPSFKSFSGVGLDAGGFDFTGNIFAKQQERQEASFNTSDSNPLKRKAKQMDAREVDADASGPRTSDDYERWLMAEPSNLELWKG